MKSGDLGLGDRGRIRSNINVTPLVSVLLVLLLNMMLMVPTHGGRGNYGLKLRRAANVVDKPDPQTWGATVTVIAIDATNRMYVNGIPVRYTDVAAKVNESLEGKATRSVLIIGDQDARYSTVMAAMDSLRAVEVVDVGLVVEPREYRFFDAGAGRR